MPYSRDAAEIDEPWSPFCCRANGAKSFHALEGFHRFIMRFDKFTIKAQEAVVRAQELAQQRNNPELLPLHLLSALLAEKEGVVHPLLQKLGGNISRIDQAVQAELDRLPAAT